MKSLRLAWLFLASFATPAVCASYDDLNAGIAARNREQWDAAIVYLGKAISANDLIPSLQYIAHLDRSEARVAKGDLDGAIADITACLALKPADTTALLSRVTLYVASGKLDEARLDVDSILAGDPEDSGAYATRATISELQGDPEKELADLQIAASKNPGSTSIRMNIGIAYFQLGKTDEASEAFTKIIDTKSRTSYAWLWLAMSNLKGGKSVPKSVPSNYDKSAWPAPIFDFFNGRGTEESVIMASAKGEENLVRGQICEGNFYIGEWRLLHGDAAGAKTLFQKAATGCPVGFIEYFSAKEELKNAP